MTQETALSMWSIMHSVEVLSAGCVCVCPEGGGGGGGGNVDEVCVPPPGGGGGGGGGGGKLFWTFAQSAVVIMPFPVHNFRKAAIKTYLILLKYDTISCMTL